MLAYRINLIAERMAQYFPNNDAKIGLKKKIFAICEYWESFVYLKRFKTPENFVDFCVNSSSKKSPQKTVHSLVFLGSGVSVTTHGVEIILRDFVVTDT